MGFIEMNFRPKKTFPELKINKWGAISFPRELAEGKSFANIYIDYEERLYKIVFVDEAGNFKVSTASRRVTISFASAMRHAELVPGKDYLIKKYSAEEGGSIIFSFSNIKKCLKGK